VTRSEIAFPQGQAQRDGLGQPVVLAQQAGLELVEMIELLAFAERGMIRDVIGDADELVEGQNGAAMAGMNEMRGDGKVLVAMGLA